MNFYGGATSLDSFLKAYKTSETKGFVPYEWFDHPDKLQNPELPPYDAFYSKLRSCNPLETGYTDYVNLLKSGLSTDWIVQAVIKLKLSKPPPTGIENYYLQEMWKQEQMSSFLDFLRWYNNIDVVPTLEAMLEMIAFYHDKNIDMLKLGCTLPNLANICLHKSTDAKFYPSTEADKDLLEKIREDVVGGHLSFLHAKQLLMKLLSESLQTYANLLLGLMPANYTRTRCVNPCPPVFIRVGISIQKPVDSHLDKTRPVALKIWACLIFNVQDLIVKLRASTLQAYRRKLIASVLMGFVLIAILCLKQWVAFITFVTVKCCVFSQEDIKRGSRRRELDELRRGYIQEKGFTVIQLWEFEWWRLYKTTTNVKLHIREIFPYRRSLTKQQLLEGIKKGNLFGYVQRDIEVPENLRENFANFRPVFKNILVSKNDIGDFMKTYAKEEGIMSQPRKLLISGFTLQNGTLTTPLLLFYLQLGLVVTKIHRSLEYTSRKCFNSFVQAAVDARRKGDENPNSSVVAETMKLLANSSSGYQIMDQSRYTVTKYLSDEKTHAAFNSKLFRKLYHLNNSLYEVELAKTEFEHKEPIIVGFFILQYEKLRMLELFYNFFTRFCDVN